MYGSAEPKHYGTVVSGHEGGNDPIHGISVYLRDEPAHFHFVTYGFTELWTKESEDAETSGFGFELTFRLAREEDEEEPPMWALNFLQNLGRYVFRTGNAFAAGHKMGLNGPIALGERTSITAVCFASDPELGEIRSPNGQAEFLQIVGISDDEYRLIQDWCTDGLLELLAARSPLLITELWRPSILDRPGVAELLKERIDREGSSETSSFAGDLSYDSDGSRVVMTLGALYAPAIRRAMLGRIRHRRRYQLMGKTQGVVFEPGEAAWRISEGNLVLGVPPNLAKQLALQVGARAGRYELPIPGVTLVVAPTYIRDQSGRVIDVKGVAEDEIEELAAAENAKLDPPPSVVAKLAKPVEKVVSVIQRAMKSLTGDVVRERAERVEAPLADVVPKEAPDKAQKSAKTTPAAKAAKAKAAAKKPKATAKKPAAEAAKPAVKAKAAAKPKAAAKKPAAKAAKAKVAAKAKSVAKPKATAKKPATKAAKPAAKSKPSAKSAEVAKARPAAKTAKKPTVKKR